MCIPYCQQLTLVIMGGRVMLVIGALLMLLMTSVDNGVVDGSGGGVVAGVGYQYHCYWW